MSEPAPAPVPSSQDTASAFDLRSYTIAAYVLFLFGWMNGITAVIALILAYVKRREAAGTIWASHFDNIILVFWVSIAGFFVGLLTWPLTLGIWLAQGPLFWPGSFTLPFIFGVLVFPLLALWALYRLVRGLIRATELRPY